VVLALGVAAFVVVFAVNPSGRSQAKEDTKPVSAEREEDQAVRVKVVRPRMDPSFAMTVTQPAYVAAYYQVDLRARVAGVVREVTKAIGDRVNKDEPLIKISVLDLVEDVKKKEAVVRQRQRELEVAKARVGRARAAVAVAHEAIGVKAAEVDVARAIEKFRGQEVVRFSGLAKDGDITGNVVAERRKFAEAATAEVKKARDSVKQAEADEEEAKAKVQEALADVELKKTLIEVAQKDLDQTSELLKFATVTAPFAGAVTQRNVDPGSFVQNSAGSPGPALLTVERNDLLTIYANIPDNYAPAITGRTEVIIELGELPGVQIQARVTRRSGSLQNPNNDRTMRVEVDLFNGGGKKAFEAFLQQAKANKYADLKGGKRYVFVVRDGMARLTPVEVQVDDGILAKVNLIEMGQPRPLRGDELVVPSNQAELSEGQQVNASEVTW
jgi:multidrug resistance efflux pump